MIEEEGTLTLKLKYKINQEARTVQIQHPSLSGVLGFEFTSMDLAEIQLQAIREDREETFSNVESIVSDSIELLSLISDLKETLKKTK